MEQRLLYVVEHPGISNGRPAYHHAVYAVAAEGLGGLLACTDVAIAYKRDAQARIFFHARYHLPVGGAGIHLRACAAMDGQGGDAAVLELLGKFDDYLVLVVPAQPCLYRDGDADCLYHFAGNLKHFRDVAEHSGAGSLAGHFLHGAAEIDVEHVGSGLLHHPGGLDHRSRLAAINLDGRGALRRFYVELARGGGDVADQGVGADKLAVGHVGPELLAYEPERLVGHILHRREHHGALAQVDISYFHSGNLR